MPQQVLLHCCGRDLLLTTSSPYISLPIFTCSVFTSHTLSPWQKTPLEIGRTTVDFRWLQRAVLATVKAEKCDV